MATQEEALLAVRTLISYLGDDPDREGLQDTPARVLKAWRQDWARGYTGVPTELIRLFERTDGKDCISVPRYNQMVVIRDIDVFSHCEHHMTPFFGKVHIAYVPDTHGLIGLSKMARIVNHFARRLQVQERLTEQVADFLAGELSADVGVRMSCIHMCMLSRGVQQAHSSTLTTALRGAFYDDPTTRQEFLQACA